MTRHIKTIVILVVALLTLVVFFRLAANAARGGEESPLYSTRRHDPFGTAALLAFLEHRGTLVRVLERPRLDPTDHGTLIQTMAIPRLFNILADDDSLRVNTQQLIAWMQAGNTIIQLTRAPTDLMMKCNVPRLESDGPLQRDVEDAERVGDYESVGQSRTISAEWPTGSDAPPLTLTLKDPSYVRDIADTGWAATMPAMFAFGATSMPATLPFVFNVPEVEDEPWTPLATAPRGVVAMQRRVGKGRLIVILAPTPVLDGATPTADPGGFDDNSHLAGIAFGDNLELILGLIGREPVILDDWSKGIGHSATVMGLIEEVGLLPVVLQVVFLLILYSWSTRGHKRPERPPEARRRSSIEQVHTLGYLYSQALSPAELRLRVDHEVRRRVGLALRCPPNQIERRLRALPPDVAQRAADVLLAAQVDEANAGANRPHCGYNLIGNTTGTCPECGAPVDDRVKERIEIATASSGPGAAGAAGAGGREATAAQRRRIESSLAAALSKSHQFLKESTRDRRANAAPAR